MTNHRAPLGLRSTTRAQVAWQTFRHDERGEGLVSFLIIAVAVAGLALFVLGVFDEEVRDKVDQLDLNERPADGNE